jgi:hypothetical protein
MDCLVSMLMLIKDTVYSRLLEVAGGLLEVTLELEADIISVLLLIVVALAPASELQDSFRDAGMLALPTVTDHIKLN